MPDLALEFRRALRRVRSSPAFFASAASLVAIGLAATAAIFTLVDALLLRPLPVQNPGTLVQLLEQQPNRPPGRFFDYGFFQELAASSSTLFNFGGQIETTRALEHNGVAERIHTAAVTDGYFRTLGVQPLLGRVPSHGERHAAVLSFACWSRAYGREPTVLGQTVRLQDLPYRIVGVMPEPFTGTTVDSTPDLWIPYADLPELARTPGRGLDTFALEIIARLRPGVSLKEAEQETAAFWNPFTQKLALAAPGDYRGLTRGRLVVDSIALGVSQLRSQSRTALILLFAGTGLLLLMVCANVGGLLLSRAIARDRETAIRVALGASRARIARQWLFESLLVTGMGGCCGLLLAHLSLPLLVRCLPPAHGLGLDPGELRSLTLHPALDLRVAAFSLLACLLTAVLCALAPAWRSSRPDLNIALKSSANDHGARVAQSVLCGFQIALCTTLLTCAGLVVRTLINLRAADTGFDVDHVIEISIDPHVRGYDSSRTWALQQRLLNSVRKLPGVENAALANRGLMRGIGLGNSVVFPGQRGTGIVNASINTVTPGYFDVLKMRLLEGRNFGPFDRWEENKLNQVIVNEAFVRRFLEGKRPLGERFDTGQRFVKPRYEIIGVVNDTKYRSMREAPPPTFFTYNFGPDAYPDPFILHIRSYGDARATAAPVLALLRSIDPRLPVYHVATLAEQIDRSLWQERLLAALASCFGAFALLLSAIGLYGALAYFVTKHERDIGIRMALGATPANALWLIASRIVPMLAAGVPGGLAIAWLTSALLRSFLYGVRPFDAMSSVVASSLLVAIGIAGAAIPSLRASHLDPASTLRQE